MNTYYKESTEFQEVGVSLDDLPTTQFEVAVLPVGTRPTTEWAQPYELEAKKGVLLEGLTAGDYAIWVRVTDLPETPVLYAGRVSII